ncbi:hypothetical protein C484_14055 [Natrialba taiwanensis DSM 12281]|uniref:Uncharacterized protein n=1 Tax=Natrialba taiwanensis DSM 12281 TaxID=1230458 RepID=L9ZSS2_9EURY|nr:hypothetical protein C484_14055 [Natrialba taiwanensis DSM 12281]
MNPASGADVPEAAVLDRVVGSFDACPVVVRLVQDRLLQLNVLAMFLDAIFDPVPDVFRVVSVSWIVRSDWHDPCGQQVVVPIETLPIVLAAAAVLATVTAAYIDISLTSSLPL